MAQRACCLAGPFAGLPEEQGLLLRMAGGRAVSLVRLAPGAAAPRHTRLGIEATLIVQGGFADQFGQYERGDAWIVDGSVDHAPVALAGEPCLSLVYQDAPLKLTG